MHFAINSQQEGMGMEQQNKEGVATGQNIKTIPLFGSTLVCTLVDMPDM